MKLPIKTNENIKSILKNYAEKSLLYFKVFFIKGILNDQGQLAEGAVAPRFIIIWSDNFELVGQAVDEIKKLFGSAVSYELSEGHDLPEDSTSHDLTSLHQRSRLFNADETATILRNAAVEIAWAYLMKSSIHLVVEEIDMKDPTLGKIFQTKVFVRPSTADIIYDSGKIIDHNFVDLIERTINQPHFNYEEQVDKNFDTLFFETPFFRGEVVPPETNKELMELVRKNYLIAVPNGKYHVSVQDKSKK